MDSLVDNLAKVLTCTASKDGGTAEDSGVLACCNGPRAGGPGEVDTDVMLSSKPRRGTATKRGTSPGKSSGRSFPSDGKDKEFDDIMEDAHMIKELCEGSGASATPAHSSMQPRFSALVIALGRMDRKRRTCVMLAVPNKHKDIMSKAFKDYIDQMEEMEIKLKHRAELDLKQRERQKDAMTFDQEFIDIITGGGTDEDRVEKDTFGPWLQQHWDAFHLTDAEKLEMKHFLEEIKKTGAPKKAYVPSHIMSQLARGGNWSG
mmetsp:Transcript_1090/g.2368  ORF Transcript_1090/g.2368 Transcript_1090/m.2368 type:complete len:261 (-) Transcript_1090:270-1052(-)|eukprot:CAMPEP_0173378700 /NCGR_PEP_ID=MMETSP1356-20130122/1825_1 /TAXON_ID=77927 ORGANISM="Hemiselmis virescens, Strain PCC157" /NCGR_SAMPLE_ID=MMETSP1356 /ASSEMBLY_ACC=CAM_ASM_000847 /LENGTH=260 /DNA_ID=CAMNT_0014331853 /DNA_START=225 /DNA_END=1007 /DNA_ORIENTATION=+